MFGSLGVFYSSLAFAPVSQLRPPALAKRLRAAPSQPPLRSAQPQCQANPLCARVQPLARLAAKAYPAVPRAKASSTRLGPKQGLHQHVVDHRLQLRQDFARLGRLDHLRQVVCPQLRKALHNQLRPWALRQSLGPPWQSSVSRLYLYLLASRRWQRPTAITQVASVLAAVAGTLTLSTRKRGTARTIPGCGLWATTAGGSPMTSVLAPTTTGTGASC
jgi:hypothetical protein